MPRTQRTTLFRFPVETGFDMQKCQRKHLIHCLRVAATKFDDDAKLVIGSGGVVMGEELQRYAAEAREIADRLEDADYIRVGTVKAANKGTIPEA
jgi:hypothetical protein